MSVYDNYEPPVSAGLYHKFENGITYRFRLLSEPAKFTTLYNGDPEKANTKYAWLAFNKEEKKIQILQLPLGAYNQIAKFAKDSDYGDPTKYDLKFTRSGEGFKTKYDIVAAPEKSVIPESLAVEAAEYDLLEKVSSGKDVSDVQWLSEAAAEDKGAEEVKETGTPVVTEPPKADDDGEDW